MGGGPGVLAAAAASQTKMAPEHPGAVPLVSQKSSPYDARSSEP